MTLNILHALAQRSHSSRFVSIAMLPLDDVEAGGSQTDSRVRAIAELEELGWVIREGMRVRLTLAGLAVATATKKRARVSRAPVRAPSRAA